MRRPRDFGHPDDAWLLMLEAQLLDEDPQLAHKFELFATFGCWPVRALTTGWILWVAGLLCAFLIWHNPAALVLGVTLLCIYPLGMATARHRRRHR